MKRMILMAGGLLIAAASFSPGFIRRTSYWKPLYREIRVPRWAGFHEESRIRTWWRFRGSICRK